MMTENDLTFYSSWVSIISFFMSIVSLVVSVWSLILVGSVKANLVKHKKKQRLRQLIDEINRIHDDALPLSEASRTKLASLKRNIPVGWFANCSDK